MSDWQELSRVITDHWHHVPGPMPGAGLSLTEPIRLTPVRLAQCTRAGPETARARGRPGCRLVGPRRVLAAISGSGCARRGAC